MKITNKKHLKTAKPSVNNVMTLKWYVPEGVALIVIE